jgi:hypothetical protein
LVSQAGRPLLLPFLFSGILRHIENHLIPCVDGFEAIQTLVAEALQPFGVVKLLWVEVYEGAVWERQNPSLSSSKGSFVCLKNKPFQQTTDTGQMYSAIPPWKHLFWINQVLTGIAVLGAARVGRRCF